MKESKNARNHLFLVIIVILVFSLGACASQTNNNASTFTSSTLATTEDKDIVFCVSCLDEKVEGCTSNREKFLKKYSSDYDFLYCEIDDTFYELLLNNPIDGWRESRQLDVMSFSEMRETEFRAYSNWIRECNASVAFLCENFPDISEAIAAEQLAWEKYINSYVQNMEMTVYNMGIGGELQWLNIDIEKTNLARQRAFHLAYLEYISILHLSPCSESNAWELIEITFS